MPTNKTFDQPLIFVNLYQHAKIRVTLPHWPQPFLDMPTPKILNDLLICMNLYQLAKTQLILSVHS